MTDNQHQILVVSRRAGGTRPSAGYRIVRVDRVSALGNPFIMKSEAERDSVCDQYDAWLKEHLANGVPAVCDAFESLLGLYRKGYALALECWCAPKRCHAESIRAAVLTAAKGLHSLNR